MSINPFWSLSQLAQELASGRTTSEALARLYLDRIERADARLHAFVSVDPQGALGAARASDARRAAGQSLGPLDGMPLAVKDLFEIDGQVTTFGSAAWLSRRSVGTAACVARLQNAGMVILGKTHMTEFAFGLWGTNPLMGTPWNPWDLSRHRIPGGSSSGSAVAVAAGLAPAAIGSDTGGSVRVPAALCGITGLKTSRDLISLERALALSPTLDSVGPLCRDVRDAALLTDVMAGAKVCGLATGAVPEPTLAGVRIFALREADFSTAVQPAVVDALRDAQAVLRALGAEVIEKPFPFDLTELARRNGDLIAAEAWRIHAAYIEDPALAIGPWVRRRVIAGKGIDAKQYQGALDHHRAMSAQWRQWLADADALLMPASPMVACPLEEVDETATPLASFARGGNYLSACALVVPGGVSREGLPIGIQLMGKPNAEKALMRIGAGFQQATRWHLRTPDLASLFS